MDMEEIYENISFIFKTCENETNIFIYFFHLHIRVEPQPEIYCVGSDAKYGFLEFQ